MKICPPFSINTIMQIFGYEISKSIRGEKSDATKKEEKLVVPVPKNDNDGAFTAEASGYYGQYLDLDGTSISSDNDAIQKYRAAAKHPECEAAIEDIVNEAIFMGDSKPVSLNLDDVELSEEIKKKISAEFDEVLKLLNFSENGSDIFRDWYIDGRLFYYASIDRSKTEKGILELRAVDPVKMRKIREVKTVRDDITGVETEEVVAEYFVYSESLQNGAATNNTIQSGSSVSGLKIDPNMVIYVPSGMMDTNRKHVVSYLHKALKLVNQVSMMENALVIYRLARAPERRIFYIDVGSLPKGKAEEYVQGVMSKYKNKLVYDASTGDISDDRKHMSMLEDFWLPRREGGKGTEITTLPGGQNLSDIEDLKYFQRKLYNSLNVPSSRLEKETGFNIGRASEISRDEVKFQKFIDKIRRKFSYLFLDALRLQLILKKVIAPEEWYEIKENIRVSYNRDNFFAESKELEILKDRIQILDSISTHVGRYFSEKWVKKHILNQTDEMISDIETENSENKNESGSEDTGSESELYSDPDMNFDSQGNPLGEPEVEQGEPEGEIPAEKPKKKVKIPDTNPFQR